MAWKARLKSIAENPVPNDEVHLSIEFYDPLDVNKKPFILDYGFHANNLQSVQALKDFVAPEVQRLNQFDIIKNILKGLIDQDL